MNVDTGVQFQVNGRLFIRYTTGQIGFNTGRPRYRVVCCSCQVEVHEATTGPEPMARAHHCKESS